MLFFKNSCNFGFLTTKFGYDICFFPRETKLASVLFLLIFVAKLRTPGKKANVIHENLVIFFYLFFFFLQKSVIYLQCDFTSFFTLLVGVRHRIWFGNFFLKVRLLFLKACFRHCVLGCVRVFISCFIFFDHLVSGLSSRCGASAEKMYHFL